MKNEVFTFDADGTIMPVAPRFRTNYNWQAPPDEYNEEPTMTVPDMALSIQEILRRHSQGRPLPASRPMFYGGDKMYPPVHLMDNVEQVDALRNMVAYQADLKQKAADRRSELAKRKEDKKQQMAEQLDLLTAIDNAKREAANPPATKQDNKSEAKRSE